MELFGSFDRICHRPYRWMFARPRYDIIPHMMKKLVLLGAAVLVARAEGGYTNHAGNVIAGWPVALTAKQVTLGARGQETGDVRRVSYPMSIFPESEQRRIAADFGTPRLPPAVKRAIAGAEKAMARSRKRAEKGLCTKEESEAFCAKSSAALRAYLDKQVEAGVITAGERKALGR